MMAHMQTVHDRHGDMQCVALLNNPDTLIEWSTECNSAVLALCSIIARGHWMLVNGHWLRKQQDGVHL